MPVFVYCIVYCVVLSFTNIKSNSIAVGNLNINIYIIQNIIRRIMYFFIQNNILLKICIFVEKNDSQSFAAMNI